MCTGKQGAQLTGMTGMEASAIQKEAHTSEESVGAAVEDADGVVEAKDLGVDLGVLVIGDPVDGRRPQTRSAGWPQRNARQ